MQAGALHWLFVVILLGTPLANAGAQTITWDGEIDNDWYNPANWDPDAYPADDANRIIFSGTAHAPIASTDVRADNGGSITVTSAGSATFEALLYIGHGNTGTLDITNGGTFSNAGCYVGFNAGSTGAVAVSEAGSTWTNRGDSYVGDYGTGTLTIAGGGAVSNGLGSIGNHVDSNGTVTVDGIGSTWTNRADLYVGHYGTGTLSIASGGAVSNVECEIGAYGGSTGTVTVEGAGSTWTNWSSLCVGRHANGTLSIADGGHVDVHGAYSYIGYEPNSNSTVTVDGAGSTWGNSGNLVVGSAGTGTLTITDGGAVSDAWDASVGGYPHSNGTVTVDGAGSMWTNGGSVCVGSRGKGTLAITGGGVSRTPGVATSAGTLTPMAR